MNYLRLLFCLCAGLFLLVSPILAQETSKDTTSTPLYQPNIEELSQLKRRTQNEATVSVAGFQTTTLRESPGIVTLITQEEILNSGAKDLLDVLRTVPGFDVAYDVAPLLTIRGSNSSEAKMLFTIDGVMMNSIAFGGIYPVMRYPLHNIDRIEIIRGAGSAQYGGMAGLAVINIISKKAKNNFEGGATATVGLADGGLMRNYFEGWGATKLANGVEIDLNVLQIAGKFNNRIDEENGLYTGRVNTKDKIQTTNSYWNFGLRYKKLTMRYINSTVRNRLVHIGDAVLSANDNFFQASYDTDLGSKLTFHSKFSWQQQTPNNFTNIPRQNLVDTTKLNVLGLFNTIDDRYGFKNYLAYQLKDNLSLTAGGEVLYDYVIYTTSRRFKTGDISANYLGLAGFAEVNFTSKYANITAGARYERYGNITPVVVPRLAITKAFEKFHFKALYSQAFKNPTLFNIEFAEKGIGNIEPERFSLIEFEIGWRPRSNLQLSTNVYYSQIQNFITRKDGLDNSGNGTASYENLGNTATRGVEAELRWQPKWGYVNLGYSFYNVVETASFLKLPRVSGVFPGVSSQKANLQVFVKILPKWNAHLSAMYINNKFRINKTGGDVREPLIMPREIHINLYTQVNDVIFKNFALGLGCFNLLDGNYRITSWKADVSSLIDMPWQGREVYVKLVYRIKN